MKGWVRLFLAVALAVMAAPPSPATTLKPMSGEELTAAASLIVVGRCTDVETRWFGRSLATLATIAVDETLKGEAFSELTLALPGGVDVERKIAVTAPGTPVVGESETLLLFLDSVDGMASTFKVVGFSQGYFPVVYDAENKALVTRSRSRHGALSLERVKAQIRAHLLSRETARK